MFSKRLFVLATMAFASLFFLSGCGGSSSPSVTVTASANTVDGTDSVTLAATVNNDKNSAGVTWTASAGTLSDATTSSATYTAPAATTSSQTVTVTATSKTDTSKTGSVTLTIPAAPAVTTTSASLASTVGSAYSVTLAASGGISPYTWQLTSGTLPSCLTLSSAGVLSGTVTAACAGTYDDLVFTATDSGSPTKLTATKTLSMTLAAATAISFSGAMPSTATYNVAYTGSAAATGGAGTLAYKLSSGSLPAGLSLNTGSGAVTGTPTATGNSTFAIEAYDSYGDSATQSYTIAVSYPAMSITAASLPTGYIGSTYTAATLTATGGTGLSSNYSWALTSGSSLPAGLSLTSGGVLSGTPTGSAETTTFSVTATDSVAQLSATRSFSITIKNGVSINAVTMPTGYTGSAYTATTLTASGGTDSYTWSWAAASGSSLPAGLSIASATGVISGTPTATGTYSVVVTATDTASNTATRTISITVAAGISITTPTIPTFYPGDASYTTPTFTASGGSGTGYTWSWAAASGSTLPSGLSLSSAGVISGTPANATTANVTSNLIVTATDSIGNTATTSITVTIEATLAISTTSLTNGAVGSVYSDTLAATGGTGTYSWTVPSNTDVTCLNGLGLNLTSAGVLTSNSTALTKTGSCIFGIQVADNASTPHTATTSLTVTVTSYSITTSTLSPAYAVTGSSYSAAISVAGGTSPYTWSISSGSLPTGLNLGSGTGSSNTISGTVDASAATGNYTFTVQVKDSSSPQLTATQQYTLTVYNPLVITTSALPYGTVGTNYSQTLGASGGSGNYSWAVTSGASSLSALGLSLNTSTGVLSGTGSGLTAGSASFTVTLTDTTSSATATQNYTVTIHSNSTLTVAVDSVPQGMVGMPYTFNNVSVSGGTGSYTIVYTGAPDGLSTDTSTNSLVGAPTASGTTTVTVEVTDSAYAYGSTTFSLPVVDKTVAAHNSYLSGQYACSLQHYWDNGVTGGDGSSTLYRGGAVFALTANGSGTISGGEIDTNSPKDGFTSASSNGSLSGTYAVGADNRGYLELTTATTGKSFVFALAGGNLSSSKFSEFAITEMDDAGAEPSGTHGSGHCYLQSTTTAFTGTQPSGGYVFNLTGEDSHGAPTAVVGYSKYSGSGTVTGSQDYVDNLSVAENVSFSGTNTTADSYGRLTMSPSSDYSLVLYMTNNTKGQALLMSTGNHNETDIDFDMGEARKQVSANVTASHPLKGSGILYVQGTEDVLNSSPTYKAQVAQFTGSSSANTITINSIIQNHDGTFQKDTNDIYGQTLTYSVDTSSAIGRTTFTGVPGVYLYLYDTGSAAVLFADGTSGEDIANMAGWTELQTAPTSGTWAISNFPSSYFLYKVENGDYNRDANSAVFTLDSSGNVNNFASDDGGQNWVSWDENIAGTGGSTSATAAVSLDSTDGSHGLFDLKVTAGGSTTTNSYCFAASVDAATKSGAKGRLVCVDVDNESPALNIIQE